MRLGRFIAAWATLAMSLLSPGAVWAVSDLQPLDPAALLEQLKKLREAQAEVAAARQSQVLQAIENAAASPAAAWALYQEAVKALQFEGQEMGGTKFREWKKKEEEKLDDPDLRAALPVHLSYLALTLRRAAGAEPHDLLEPLMRHTAAVDKNAAGWGTHPQIMMRPVTENVFARHFGLEPVLAQLKDWEMTPGNIDGIYEKTILSELRRQKSSRAVEYWDSRIQREARRVAASRLTHEIDRFERLRKPTLLWQRSQEFLALGFPNRAVQEMFAVLKAYPGHPDFERWAGELEAVLRPIPAADPQGGAAPADAAPKS